MDFDFSSTRIAPRREGARVLLVEPGRSATGVMARRLNEAGYRVIAAESAEKGVAELHRQPADLVLAELQMPVMSGVELTRLIRDDSGFRDIPVILITGRSDATGAIRAFEAGADDIVAKPFHNEVLLARIARQLARARAVRQLRADNATLDARVVTRAIELGEARAALQQSETERRRLTGLFGRA
ncbi:MAG: PleD family two-component system response regulator [Sphingomicrobium sp.]|nr:response regulator [Sphingomonadales bacterium]